MKPIARIAAIMAALFALTAAAPAQADPGVECTITGNVIIISLMAPVTFVCDGNATVTHTTTVTVSPKLFDPANVPAPTPPPAP